MPQNEKLRKILREYHEWQKELGESGELMNHRTAILIENGFIEQAIEAVRAEDGNN